MSIDFDYELSPDQWDTLKALRNPACHGQTSGDGPVKHYVVEDLVKLGLVSLTDGTPVLTPTGRKVLVRGSCRLLDLAS
jgi:ribosomal protein S19E (S16A)